MRRPLACCLLLFAAPFVSAQAGPGTFEITPYGAYTFGGSFSDEEDDTTVDLDDSGNFGLLLDFREGPRTQWEVIYSQQSTSADVSSAGSPAMSLDMNVHYLQGGGTYQADEGTIRPYLAATISAAYYDVTTAGYDSDTFFSFSLGPGLQIRANERLGIRLEARAFGTLVTSGSSLFCVSDPGGGTAGCAVTVAGKVLWQFQAMAGVVFRF